MQSNYNNTLAGVLSAAIWTKIEPLDCIENPNEGFLDRDDFLAPKNITPTVTAKEGYFAFLDAGCSVQGDGTPGRGGYMRMRAAGTANLEASFQRGNGVAGIAAISSASPKPTAFEAVLRAASVAAVSHAVGLKNPGLTGGMIVDGGASIEDGDFAGFLIVNGTVKCIYQKTGQAEVLVKDAVHTLVADTDTRLGIRYDGDFKTLEYYVNGVCVARIDNVGSATNFPLDVLMVPTFACKTTEAVQKDAWIDIYQFGARR